MTGRVIAGHGVHKRSVLGERKTQWELSKSFVNEGLNSLGRPNSYWPWCNMCKYVPHKDILLPSNKKDGSSIYILVYFLIQPIHLFFLPAAYIKCSLVCQVCQGCVRVALWELQLWGAVSWCCLLHIILIFPLCLLLSTSISVSQINFSPEMIKKTLMIFRICSLVYPWDKADFCCL